MIVFGLFSVALVMSACLMLALPLFRHNRSDDLAERDELNKALYRQRLCELNAEIEEGVALEQDDLVSDLKQSLLDDVPVIDPGYSVGENGLGSPVRLFWSSAMVLIILSYGIYFSVGALPLVSHWQETRSSLNPLLEKLMSGQGESMTKAELQDMVLGLRTRLYETPDDADGWLLLGRIALSGQDLQTGGDAMRKAYKLAPENADIRLGYAQALMMTQNEADQNEGRDVLMGLLRDEVVDLRIYSMLAFDAYRRQEYRAAIQYWHVMQQLIGTEDSRYLMLQRSIDNARSRLKEKTE